MRALVVVGSRHGGTMEMGEWVAEGLRAGGVDAEFFTTFSYHPFYLALLVAPFLPAVMGTDTYLDQLW